MSKFAILPVQYDGWDEAGDFGDMMIYKVKFTADFGPWKKGEVETHLNLIFSQGFIESETKKCEVQLRPKEES